MAAKWYAIQTVPGAQKPQREYAVERTSLGKDGRARGKGYRIVPSLNPNLSAVERALTENGFTHYMPAEKRLIRDRRHTDLFKVRRFALIVGYVFVHEPHSWRRLEDTPGVAGIVKTANGTPLPLDLLDILMVRAAEAQAEVDFDIQNKRARQNVRKRAKRDPRLKMLVDKLDIAGTLTFSLDSDFVAA